MESHRRLLAGAGYDVRVVAGRGDCKLIPEVDSRHPAVEAVAAALATGSGRPDEFADLVKVLERRLAENLDGVDLVIAHNVMTMHFNLPLTAALASRPRVLAWTHDLAWANDRYASMRRDGFPYDLLHRPAANARYVAISKPVADLIREVYSRPAPVVRNGVDRLSLLRIRPQTIGRLMPTGLAQAYPMVLVPFRVTRRKRLELALRTAAALAPRHPRLMVVVSGPLGPHSSDNLAYWSELQQLRAELQLERQVVFLHELGHPHQVDDEMVKELYQLASVVLLTSDAEGFGLPVLEAGLARVPVVCTDLEVFRDLAGDNAWRFPVGAGADVIASAVESALATRQVRLQSRVGDHFSWDLILPRIEEEIRLALA